MFSSVGKTLLKNVIRHTDHHNRRVEESDMWRSRNLQVSLSNDHDDRDRLSDRRQPYENQVSNSTSSNRRAHMDDIDHVSTYWTRELHKAEEQNPDRWGHGGYKEMYPDDFHSDRSGDERKKRHLKRKKRKKEKKSKKRRKTQEDSHGKRLSVDSESQPGHRHGEGGEDIHKTHRTKKEHKTKRHKTGSDNRHHKTNSKHKRLKTEKEVKPNDCERGGSDSERTSVSESSADEIYRHKSHKRR